MPLDRSQLKAEARQRLRTAQVNPYAFTLLLLLVTGLLSAAGTYASAPRILETYRRLQELSPGAALPLPYSVTFFASLPALPSKAAVFLTVLSLLLGTLIRAGAALYHLGVFRGEEKPFSTLLEGFGMAGKVILLAVLETVFVLLWSLLLYIPGIVAIYRYRFALYNLCENPELSPLEAIRMSKAQTDGFKWKLFVLDLSSLGWRLLSSLTLGVLDIWLAPYVSQTDVGYFQTIKRLQGVGALPQEPPAEG